LSRRFTGPIPLPVRGLTYLVQPGTILPLRASCH
jgi:hypothetical protein